MFKSIIRRYQLWQFKRHLDAQTEAWNEYLDTIHRVEHTEQCNVTSLYVGFCAGWNSHRAGRARSMWDSSFYKEYGVIGE